VVAKGETLTSIARQYKVSVAELLQANKIVDDRKLQIGQTLVIPSKSENSENTQKPSGGN
jgi:LysM repeat protein